MIGAPVVVSQSQHKGRSRYHTMWLRPKPSCFPAGWVRSTFVHKNLSLSLSSSPWEGEMRGLMIAYECTSHWEQHNNLIPLVNLWPVYLKWCKVGQFGVFKVDLRLLCWMNEWMNERYPHMRQHSLCILTIWVSFNDFNNLFTNRIKWESSPTIIQLSCTKVDVSWMISPTCPRIWKHVVVHDG